MSNLQLIFDQISNLHLIILYKAIPNVHSLLKQVINTLSWPRDVDKLV